MLLSTWLVVALGGCIVGRCAAGSLPPPDRGMRAVRMLVAFELLGLWRVYTADGMLTQSARCIGPR